MDQQWPAFDAPIVPNNRPLRWDKSRLLELELHLSAQRLRTNLATWGKDTQMEPAIGDGSPQAIQKRIEIAYEDWLQEEAARRRVSVSYLLEEVSARFWQSARLSAMRSLKQPFLGGAAPASITVGLSAFHRSHLTAEAMRRGISMNALIELVADQFANRAFRRAEKQAPERVSK